MVVSVAVAVIAILIALGKFTKRPELNEPQGLGGFLAHKWYIDELYDAVIVNPLNALAGFFKNIIEKSGIDGIVNGVGRFILYSSRQIRLVQSGQVGSYILFMVLAIIVLVLIWINDGYIYTYLSKIF
jgi:NADH-quinone oxidoreductase subunit L